MLLTKFKASEPRASEEEDFLHTFHVLLCLKARPKGGRAILEPKTFV